MPTQSFVSRRRVLVGAAAFAALGAAAACGKPAPRPDVDAMTAELTRATADADLATRAATGAPPPVAKALKAVAAERTSHGQALTDELTRMLGAPPTTSTSASATSATTTTSGPPPKPPAVRDVVAALEQSATAAGTLAAQQSGYRAGLLGSIAASCTSAATVALGGDGG